MSWDSKDGRSNSSDEFIELRAEIERLIRQDAYQLIHGRADRTAGLILAQLTHVHGFGPVAELEEENRRLGRELITALSSLETCHQQLARVGSG